MLSRFLGLPFGVTWCLEGEGTGGGTGSGSGSGSGGSNDPPHRETAASVVAQYNGDAIRLAGDLADARHDNFKLRDKNRDLQRDLEAAKTRVPGEGAVVLTPEQATQWAEFQKLTLKPADIATQLTAGQAAIKERDGLKHTATLEEAAKLANFKPGVLKLLAKDLPVSVREVDVPDAEGKTTKQPRAFVVGRNGEQETLTPLRDYFSAQGNDVLASLEAGKNSTDNAQGAAQGAYNGYLGGTPYPPQGGGTNGVVNAGLPANRYAHNIK